LALPQGAHKCLVPSTACTAHSLARLVDREDSTVAGYLEAARVLRIDKPPAGEGAAELGSLHTVALRGVVLCVAKRALPGEGVEIRRTA